MRLPPVQCSGFFRGPDWLQALVAGVAPSLLFQRHAATLSDHKPRHIDRALLNQEAFRCRCRKAGMSYFMAAGEKLIEAKGQVGHGEFEKWVKRHFDFSIGQARGYMTLVRKAKNGGRPPKSVSSAEGRDPRQRVRRDYQPEIDAILAKVDFSAIKQAALKEREEYEVQQKLALQLVDAGYKALASKLHPDKGGSTEAMARLNRVRDRLKASA